MTWRLRMPGSWCTYAAMYDIGPVWQRPSLLMSSVLNEFDSNAVDRAERRKIGFRIIFVRHRRDPHSRAGRRQRIEFTDIHSGQLGEKYGQPVGRLCGFEV